MMGLTACISTSNEIVVHRLDEDYICVYQTEPDTITFVELWHPNNGKHKWTYKSCTKMLIPYHDSTACTVTITNTRSADKTKRFFISSIR